MAIELGLQYYMLRAGVSVKKTWRLENLSQNQRVVMNATRMFLVLALSLGVVCGQAVFGQTLGGPTIPKALNVTVPPVKVMVGRKGMPLFRIAPPANFAVQPKTATFTINYLAAGEANDYGDVCIGWPDEAKAGFSYAANIWGSLLNSSVPIKISAYNKTKNIP